MFGRSNLATIQPTYIPYQFTRGDLVYVDLGAGINSEQCGKTLCVIIQNDIGNKYSSTTIVAVVSNKNRDLPTHYTIDNYEEFGLSNSVDICFEQIRTISKSRIISEYPVGHFDIDILKEHLLTTFGFIEKSKFENRKNTIVRGGIYYVDLGEGEGSEQCGKRPCIVIQNDCGNAFSRCTIVAAISSKIKNLPSHYFIENHKEIGLDLPSQIYLEQVRTISKERIIWERPVGIFNVDMLKDMILMNFGF